jgi:hypothetical protein
MIDSKTYYGAVLRRAYELYPDDIAARDMFCILAAGRISQMQQKAAIKATIKLKESYDEYRERVKQKLSEDKET